MMLEIVKPTHVLMTPPDAVRALLPLIEEAGRVCYKSEGRIGDGSAEKFVRSVVKRGHESGIEHGNVTVKIICDRSCSHQLVRHRIAAYSQESQRYCDYGKLGLKVICPPTVAVLSPGAYDHGTYCWYGPGGDVGDDYGEQWLHTIQNAYEIYLRLRERGVPPEDARSVLPNATKTEVVTTFNLRQWRHVFKDRALNPKAQWQIRGIMLGVLRELAELLPAVFGDLLNLLPCGEAAKP